VAGNRSPVMIDIHTHILPGVDDGAADLAESLAMARLAVEHGTTVLFATPHVSDRPELARVGQIAGLVAELQAALAREEIPLCIEPGAEVYPLENLLAEVDKGLPLTLGQRGRYLLLDSPFGSLPMGLSQTVFLLQTRGITPILAHPERVMPIQQNPQVLEEMVQRGVLLQINATSVLGRHGETAQETAFLLLRQRWVHFLASDAHSIRGRRPTLDAAAQELRAQFGDEVTTSLTLHNGERLLRDEEVPSDPLPYTPPPRLKKSWFTRLLHGN